MPVYTPNELPDPRNADIKIWVGDGLKPRDEATVSVFDSVVQGGDAVWEGIRVYDGRIFQLDAHLNRLMDSARAMAFADIPTRRVRGAGRLRDPESERHARWSAHPADVDPRPEGHLRA